MDERCENCKFWKKVGFDFDDHVVDGYCRRFPPVPCVSSGYTYHNERDCNREMVVNGETSYLFPIINEHQWCGEWKEGGNE